MGQKVLTFRILFYQKNICIEFLLCLNRELQRKSVKTGMLCDFSEFAVWLRRQISMKKKSMQINLINGTMRVFSAMVLFRGRPKWIVRVV